MNKHPHDMADMRLIVCEKLTGLCLWCIRRLNRWKDRCLSQVLFDLAEQYNTRPRMFNYAVENDEETTNEQT